PSTSRSVPPGAAPSARPAPPPDLRGSRCARASDGTSAAGGSAPRGAPARAPAGPRGSPRLPASTAAARRPAEPSTAVARYAIAHWSCRTSELTDQIRRVLVSVLLHPGHDLRHLLQSRHRGRIALEALRLVSRQRRAQRRHVRHVLGVSFKPSDELAEPR